MIALITPTGGRKEQIALCEKWMQNQTYAGKVLWVIVDDGRLKTTGNIKEDFKEDWTIVKVYPKPKWKKGENTQARNLQAGLDVVKDFLGITYVFIIEDDDYYAPNYLEEMEKRFVNGKALGQEYSTYYHIGFKKVSKLHNTTHSSLFETAFCSKLIPAFEHCLDNKKLIDMVFWHHIPKSKRILFKVEKVISIGIKGGYGRKGITRSHTIELGEIYSLPFTLKELIGEDAKYYLANENK